MPWTPYARPLTLAQAAHLLRRAGFGANATQLQRALDNGPQSAVDRIAHEPADLAAFERSMVPLEETGDNECAQLWLYRMRETPWPLLEKLTLFWHNYFAVSAARVNRAELVAQHLRLLRHHALGRFDALLHDIALDSATLIANGLRSIHQPKPPTDLSIALIERYTEPGAPSLAAALANPATPRRVVRALYRWLVSETEAPPDTLIAPLAQSFAKDYDIARLVGTILRSNHFFSPAAYRRRVKSPVEYALSIAIPFDAPVVPATLYPQLAHLGQRLLDPPTSDGWAGGRRWLNRFTIVARSNLASSLLSVAQPEKQPRLLELLVQNDVPAAVPRNLTAHDIVTLPEFQLA